MKPFHSYTNEFGVTKTFYSDGEGGITVEASQDLTPIFERNKALANENGKRIVSDVANAIATIPNIFVLKWLNEEGFLVYDANKCELAEKKLNRKLNDPQYRFLRTSELHL